MIGKRYRQTVKLNLALQGGGAHGAFTWGVLDRLLEDESVEVGWISGTSAGAVNAVAMVAGLATNGREGARANLRRVWEAVEVAGLPDFLSFLPGIGARRMLGDMAAVLSPYSFNPLGVNPLRDLLLETIDFTAVRNYSGVDLLIAATEVTTGRPRLFRREELSLDHLLASTCLPTLHQAVVIEGVSYWDGGFSANPDLITLASESPVEDTLIVQLNPSRLDEPPRTASDIVARVSDITFNQPLLRDVALIVEAKEARVGVFSPSDTRLARLRRHRYHLIAAGRHTAGLGIDSKLNPDRRVLKYLFEAGRHEAAGWADRYLSLVGVRASTDLRRAVIEGDTDADGSVEAEAGVSEKAT